jgi:anaerobic selenocysteine-containing dehydrogenase
MVAIDLYINETTRFADIILPPAHLLADDHLDTFFGNVMVHNAVRWSAPVVQPGPDEKLDWQIMMEIATRLGGGPTGIRWLDWALRPFNLRQTPDQVMDWALRMGPYGDRFRLRKGGLNGRALRAAEHGVDLGPLRTGHRHRVRYWGGKIRVAPQLVVDALKGLAGAVQRVPEPGELLLIGRRDLRSNNSWMHNVPALMRGKDRCVLFVHPDDARRLGVVSGANAVLESRVYQGQVTVHITDEVRPGVVSLPHGWGHGTSARWQSVAGQHAGVSFNDWADDEAVDSMVGQSILNGVPVRLRAIGATEARAANEVLRPTASR